MHQENWDSVYIWVAAMQSTKIGHESVLNKIPCSLVIMSKFDFNEKHHGLFMAEDVFGLQHVMAEAR